MSEEETDAMDYFKLIKQINPGKTAIIEDGKPYTYGNLVEMAVIKATEIKKNSINLNKQVYIIKEKSILRQLVLFLACNATGVIPVIVPYDVKAYPDIIDVPDNTCMAVMTSGTTGSPELFYRTYRSWADFFPIQNKIFGINRDSVLFAHGSLAFTGNMNIYMAQFYAGATIVAENKFNPRSWVDIIKKENVNAIYLIPSKLMLLPGIMKESNNNIKSVKSGSQSLGINDSEKLKNIFPNAGITLYYGASELNYITYVKDKDMTEDKNLIGKPFPGVRVYIDNSRICVDSSFHVEGVECPYIMPDMGHMDSDGNLYFDGRSDDIVLIHGRKVSLTHIENELEKSEEVNEAVVIYDNNILAAFIDIKDQYKENCLDYKYILKILGNKDNIFNKLRKVLAHYEMPDKIIVLNKMFYNESGKKDKKKILKIYRQYMKN